MLITVSWLVPPPIELLLKNLITFRNRLRLGAVLNVHKFFRRFVKPFIWFVHYTGFHFFIQTLLQIAVAATYQTSPHLILALVNRISLFSGCLLLITTLIIFLHNIFFYTLVPLVIIIVFTMMACGIFVIVALKRSLDESNSRKGFLRNTVLVVASTAFYLVIAGVFSVDTIELSAAQVWISLFSLLFLKGSSDIDYCSRRW